MDADRLEVTDDEEEEGDTSESLEESSAEAALARHSVGVVTDAAIVMLRLRNKSSPRESRAKRL